ncbi:hypothetical protein BST83_12150 [Polaribacter filamentus]|uniref:Glycosyltransferase 2-like domain-containing protein n=1 Tax=Polaribacter filamentus TaxID=53483 RepID=A0A2S7KYX8_9FLAO|nr:glycosyltransferase [Polaribacter filamentus]PQB07820.1 hypothetical protein BST83_12150 [Polaribacter filamentus]
MIEITVIVVVRNEENYIINCIKSIERQFSQNDTWELIIVDGISSDNTKLRAKEYLSNQNYNFLILDNLKRTLAPGWNIGIKHSKGKYICRPDAHSKLHNNYIKEGLRLHSVIDAAAIGGVLSTKSKGYWGEIIKEALSLKMGVGNSFRSLKSSGYTDTAVYAIYDANIFKKVGYFREDLIRHQDNEMHKRISESEGKFYTSIKMSADYYCRDTIPKLLKQMYNIGKYLPDVFFDNALSLRHLVPLLFVLFIFLDLYYLFFRY